MVLFDTLTTRDGAEHQMAGLLPGKVMMGQRLAAIGLQSLALPEGELRGHTFHYSRLETLSTPYLVAFPTATVRSSMSITRVRLPHPTCTQRWGAGRFPLVENASEAVHVAPDTDHHQEQYAVQGL
jgi:hypothetical protein